jgi:molybdenum-dependent DNA-binding transcriptional regulator ModE
VNATQAPVYLSTAEIARRLGTTVPRVAIWIRTGVNGPGGARVRLDARKIGGRYRATEAAVEAFMRACDGREAPPVSETEAARQRRVDAEVRRVRKRLGLK